MQASCDRCSAGDPLCGQWHHQPGPFCRRHGPPRSVLSANAGYACHNRECNEFSPAQLHSPAKCRQSWPTHPVAEARAHQRHWHSRTHRTAATTQLRVVPNSLSSAMKAPFARLLKEWCIGFGQALADTTDCCRPCPGWRLPLPAMACRSGGLRDDDGCARARANGHAVSGDRRTHPADACRGGRPHQEGTGSCPA